MPAVGRSRATGEVEAVPFAVGFAVGWLPGSLAGRRGAEPALPKPQMQPCLRGTARAPMCFVAEP